jgi:parvulin-like peptidyl-prolyl isomerase
MPFWYRRAMIGRLRLILLAGLLCACRTNAAPVSPDAVASFKGGEVLKAELEQATRQMPAEAKSEGKKPESDPRREALESIALRKVLAPEASTADAALKDRIEQTRKKILAAALSQEFRWDAIAASDEEARAYYDAHPEVFKDPEKIRFQHIYFRAEAGEMAPAERALVRTRLENLRKEIMGGADFDAMAREYSQSADSQSGGWSGLKKGERVFGAFTEVAWGLKINQVSEVVDTPNGFHLIKLKERTPPKDRPFDAMKEFARQRAVTDKLEAKQRAFVEEAGARFGLSKHYERLEDANAKDDTVLLEAGPRKLTMRQLVERLPQPLLEHLFNGYFPTIHRFLDSVALEEMMVQEADARRVADRPAVAEAIRAATDEIRSQAAFEARLKAKVAAAPEKELRDFFTQNAKRYETLRTWDLDVILLKPAPRESPWQVLKRGEALVKRIVAGEDFAALARTHSRHYSASAGGRMMGLTDQDIAQRVQSTAKFRRMLSALEDGEVGNAMVAECYDPERLRFENTGALVVRLVKAHPPVPQPFEKVRGLVEDNYLRRNYQRLEAEMKKEVLDSVAFRVYPDRLPPL